MSLRRTALIAAIGLGLVRAHWIAVQIQALIMDFRWIYVPSTICSFLFMLPFPVLLVILYRSDATLAVSARLKLAALATALIQGILITGPNLYGWILMLRQDWHRIQAFGLATQADNLWAWFHETSTSWDKTWSLILLFAQLAFMLFLIALIRYRNQPPESGVRQSHLLREAAALATITGGLAVILSIGGHVYAALRFSKHQYEFGGSTLEQLVVRSALSMIPDVCCMIAAYIVYRSQPRRHIHDSAADETGPAE
jgi:hypothetical protein